MQNQISNEIDPSTGVTVSYLVMTFGNINIKIKTSEQRTNMHIILEKKNQMIFNLMKLLNKTNLELEKRNTNLSAIIIDLENSLLNLFKDNDYSNLFRDSLNHIANNLNEINGEIFNELINLINIVYDNYSLILNEVYINTYVIFEILRNLTKSEYTNYYIKC